MAINYKPMGWDSTKFINPSNMNHMDEGIKAACDGVDALNVEVEAVNSNLAKKMSTEGGNFTGQVGFLENTAIAPEEMSFVKAPLVFAANCSEDNTKRAGMGFHNAGVNGAFLYFDIDGKFRYISSSGIIFTLTTISDLVQSTEITSTIQGDGNMPIPLGHADYDLISVVSKTNEIIMIPFRSNSGWWYARCTDVYGDAITTQPNITFEVYYKPK